MTPLVDPGTNMEDERPTPVGSPVADIDEGMPLSPTLDADVEVARAFLEVGVLPAMVTPIVDPAVGFSLSPATYFVPPVPVMSVRDSFPPEVAAPVDLAELGARSRCAWFPRLLRWFPRDCPRLRQRCVPRQMSVRHLVW